MNSFQSENFLLNQTAQTKSYLTSSSSSSSKQSYSCITNFFKQIIDTSSTSTSTTSLPSTAATSTSSLSPSISSSSSLSSPSTSSGETCVKLGEENQLLSTSSFFKIKNKISNFNTNASTISANLLSKLEPTCCLSRELNVNESDSLQPQSPSLSSAFIDPTELKSILTTSWSAISKIFIILLDCRTYNEFNLKHIRDSVHLNCRDKLTKKRLQTRKLTVKDLISSEEIKSKFEVNDLTAKITYQVKKEDESEASTSDANNIIIIYDDTTSDLKDLQSDTNPLKIVQENIKQSGFKKECKILKGGFKKFSEMCPEFCVLKEAQVNNLKCNREIQLVDCDLRQSDIENATMTQISPFLYLGNELDSKNTNNLEQNEIYYILNVTKNIPFYATTNNSKFKLKRIAVNDNETQNLKDYFEEAIQFIDDARKTNSKVLVHCQAGISRSPTIVIAYLMKKSGLKFNDAYNKVRELRPIIAPNLIFMSQLMDYETKLFTCLNNITNHNQITRFDNFICEDSNSSSPMSDSSLSSALLTPSSSSPSSSPATNDESAFFNSTTTTKSNNTIIACN